jgi:NADH:ubiquinone oxidoreductase subunit 6 (subunit J)
MKIHDWTHLGLKMLGVYLIIIYGGALVAQIITMLAALAQESGTMWRGLYVWQGPVNSLLVLLAGVALIWKTGKITALIWKDQPSEPTSDDGDKPPK